MDRRAFLGACAAFLVAPAALARAGLRSPGRLASVDLPAPLESALETSPFVYVSPLKQDGEESTCHAEVWYAWLDGAVVLNTGSERWKARSVRRGLDRARLWVGDHGRWKGLLGTNEDFRKAPSFDAAASLVPDDEALLERVLAVYGEKYPAEIGKWRDKMRQGYRDGTRILVRYEPVKLRT